MKADYEVIGQSDIASDSYEEEGAEQFVPPPSIFVQLLHNKAALVGGSIFGLVILTAIFANWIVPFDPYVGVISERLSPPFFLKGGSFAHILGTDQLGRDVFSRMIFGLRTSMIISLAAVSIASVFGIVMGVISG